MAVILSASRSVHSSKHLAKDHFHLTPQTISVISNAVHVVLQAVNVNMEVLNLLASLKSRTSARPIRLETATAERTTGVFKPGIVVNSAVMGVPGQQRPLHPVAQASRIRRLLLCCDRSSWAQGSGRHLGCETGWMSSLQFVPR